MARARYEPFTEIDETRLRRAWGIQRRLPCHGDAITQDRQENGCVKIRVLDETNGRFSRLIRYAEAK